MAPRPHLPRRTALLAATLLSSLTACGSAVAPPHAPSPPASPTTTTSTPASTATTGSAQPHVMIVVLENKEYDDVVGNSAAPYFNKLATQFGLATDYHARTHPSLPNYIDLIAGSTLNISSDCTDCTADDGDTIVDQLAKQDIHWTAYMGGMPSTCFQGAEYPGGTTTGYAKKHNPFLYFDHLRSDPSACQNVVPESRLKGDLGGGRATSFMWVSPNLCDDGHNTDDGCGLGASDRWLANDLPAVLASSWYAQGGIVIVTFDEGSSDSACCGGAHGGRVATLVISASTKAGAREDTPVDHAGTLRTIEALYGLAYLRTAADPQSGDLMALLSRPPVS